MSIRRTFTRTEEDFYAMVEVLVPRSRTTVAVIPCAFKQGSDSDVWRHGCIEVKGFSASFATFHPDGKGVDDRIPISFGLLTSFYRQGDIIHCKFLNDLHIELKGRDRVYAGELARHCKCFIAKWNDFKRRLTDGDLDRFCFMVVRKRTSRSKKDSDRPKTSKKRSLSANAGDIHNASKRKKSKLEAITNSN